MGIKPRRGYRGITRRKSLSALAGAGALALAGCTQSTGGGSGDALSGSINIAGSSTVFPLMSAIGEDFAAEHDQVSVDISSTGSGGGFSNYFCVGDTDFNNASRPIQPAEEELCEENGVEYVELIAATDALTIVVNPEADWIDSLTVEEPHRSGRRTPPRPGTRSATSSRTRRSSGSAPPTPPGRTTTSSRAFWRSAVTLATTKRPSRTTRSHRASRAASTRSATSASRTTSRTPISSRRSGIDDGNGPVEPSLETASSGEYTPLSRPLFTYPSIESLGKEHVAEFARATSSSRRPTRTSSPATWDTCPRLKRPKRSRWRSSRTLSSGRRSNERYEPVY